MAPAIKLFHWKYEGEDGTILEMVIWQLPKALPGSAHPFKYRLFFGKPGQRMIGYDNERGKGDHRHVGNREFRYVFTTPKQLIEDFEADVRKAGGSV